MTTLEQSVAKTFLQMAEGLESGSFAEKPRIALTGMGSEHGEANAMAAAITAAKQGVAVYYIGTLEAPGVTTVHVTNAEEGHEKMAEMVEKGQVEVAPLAFMRGRTLSNAFVILDEAQNTTPGQMKMFLTRLGRNSKCVVTGDITQIDLPKGSVSGLIQVLKILKGVNGISFIYFTEEDVIRHPLVSRIVKAYAEDEEKHRPEE